MNPWLPLLSHWVQLLLIFSHWDKPGIVNLWFSLKWAPGCPSFPIERDKGLAEYVFEMRMSIKPETPTSNLTLLNLKFPVEMSPRLSPLSRWVQPLLIFYHWDKPGIVNLWFPIEMSPWFSPLSHWVQLRLHFFPTCDFPLKWVLVAILYMLNPAYLKFLPLM